MISNPEAAESKNFDSAEFDSVIFSEAGARRAEARWLHSLAAVLVVLAHAGFWWVLQYISRPDMPRPKSEEALLIDFVMRAPAPPLPSAARPTGNKIESPGRRVDSKSTSKATQTQSAIRSEANRNDRTMAQTGQFYNDDGSVRIPADVLADLARLRGDRRDFDFQLPGLDRADALLEHHAPLEYRATRFDKDWRPDQDLLTEILSRAVEATTKEVRIPIPGDSRHHVVCKVSLLALGGGCGVESNGDDDALLPGHDDPETLSAEEDRACQAWWEKIIAAKTQDEWRQTRKIYDATCRKPLAREGVMR